MNAQGVLVAVVQSTVLLLVALSACRLMQKWPAARLVICRATFAATAVILIGGPFLPPKPRPIIPVQMPAWNGARRFAPWLGTRGTTQVRSSFRPASPAVATPAIAARRHERQTPVDPFDAIRYLWLAGVALLAAHLCLGYRRLAAIRRKTLRMAAGAIVDEVSRACEDFGIAPPEIRVGAAVATPFVAGLLRPTLYVPGERTDALEPQMLGAICRHEMAHLAGKDLHWNLMYRVCTILFWPQPLLWLLMRPAIIAGEELCDQRVLWSGYSANAYAIALLRLKESLGAAGGRVPIGIGAVSIRSAFGRRIETIVSHSSGVRRELSRLGIFGVTLACASVAALTATMFAAPGLSAEPASAPVGPNFSRPGITQSAVPTTPAGWSIKAAGPGMPPDQSKTGYTVGLDSTTFHGGRASGVIRSTSSNREGWRALSQGIRADAYRGKRIRLSGFLKTKNVSGWAGLWLRIDGMETTYGFDNMADRHIHGNTDWNLYSVVLDVPRTSVAVFFGSAMEGAGETWIDDLKLEVVDPEKVSTTGYPMYPDPTNYPLRPVNLDFSASPVTASKLDVPGWTSPDGSWGDTVQLDQAATHHGKPTGTVHNATASVRTSPALFQEVKADLYRGKRILFQAYLKTTPATAAGTFVAIPGGGQWEHTPADERNAKTDKPKWELVSSVIDVPEWATSIQFGVELNSPGQVWTSRCSFKIVDPNTTSTTYDYTPDKLYTREQLHALPFAPANLDFEQPEANL